MKRTLIRDVLRNGPQNGPITVAGWVRTRRDSKGGFSFIELNDGSCLANLQLVADASLPNYKTEILALHAGASLRAEGLSVPSPGGKQALELRASSIRVLGFCNPDTYPLQKKRISFERLREIAHLRPRTNTFGAIARLRNTLARATHDFFQQRDFLYVHTPIITCSDCEGAGEMFQVTTLDMNTPPRTPQNNVDWQADFFGRRAALTVSGQLEGETHACALGNIYTFGPTFRAEKSNTRRHLAEFWMIEPEMAFADLQDDADLAEDYLRHLFAEVLHTHPEELAFFDQHIAAGLSDRLAALAECRFERITYTEAIHLLQQADASFEFPPQWGMDLQSEHERHLTEQLFHGPVTVTD
ncbi:MAG: asparagine--tRNA ligase, partial [Kiritimatiellae bacterium]|nr:asparagine--tRNA ligase [Kiritimatiellia bacterium]